MSINTVSLSGNLTRDAELRAVPSGSKVLEFTLAVNGRVCNSVTGEWEDKPNFFECVLIDKTGNRSNALQPKLTKGVKAAVAGELRYEEWEKDGQTRSKVKVRVFEIEILQYQQNANRSEDIPF